MRKTVPPTAPCGARRPGWEHGPAIGINRIPCVHVAGHTGEHANAFGQTWPAVPSSGPTGLSSDTRRLLGMLADRLDGYRPDAEMLAVTRLAQAIVLAEQLHGPTEAAYAAEKAFLAAAPRVRRGQTRGGYARLLRLLADGSKGAGQ